MGIFREAGHNIGVFALTFVGIIAFVFFMLFVLVKYIVPLIIDKISQNIGF
jgi:hypothetical protein